MDLREWQKNPERWRDARIPCAAASRSQRNARIE
jgi:hypothetical protein